MKKWIINSKLVRAFAFLLGFIFAFMVIWDGEYYGRSDEGAVEICLLLFCGVMAFTVVAVWKQEKHGGFLRKLVKLDYGFLAITVLMTFIIGLRLINLNHAPNEITSFAVYVVAYFLLITGAAHIRGKTLFKSFYIASFFKNHRKDCVFFCVLILAFSSLVSLFVALSMEILLYFVYLFPIAYASLIAVCLLCQYLSSLSEEYDKAVEERMKSERMKIELISNVSHDLRTPLTSIINYIDLIKRLDIDDASLAEYVAVLEKKAARMKRLAGDLIDASKAGSGDVRINEARLDLAELIGQVAGEFDSAMTEAGLTLVMSLPPAEQERVMIQADGAQLWRVMENVFCNAAKYSLSGTRVYCHVGIEEGGRKAVFSLKNVSKDALNISPDELTERFVRGDVSRTDEGSGLGLYIAKSLAELMGAKFAIGISGDLFEARIEFSAV